MKYTIIEASSVSELIRVVNDYIVNGWTLQGGVCRDRYWYQAMTRVDL